MTLAEYYGFPEGTNCTRAYYNIIDDGANYPIEGTLKYFFAYQDPRLSLPDFINVKCKSIEYFMQGCSRVSTLDGLQYLDTSQCTTMKNAFYGVGNSLSIMDAGNQNLDVTPIKDWDTSQVTDMSAMFQSTLIKEFNVNWDTSKVTTMNQMFYSCSKLTTICALDCSSITQNNYPLNSYTSNNTVTTLGGFINMKSSWDNNYGLSQFPKLTYESCINVLNGLYDFTGNNQTPTSTQGKLKVHQNFLDLVGDKISIGTNKGWTIIA